MARNMARKKSRSTDSDATLTRIFLGLLFLAGLAGLCGQLARMGAAP